VEALIRITFQEGKEVTIDQLPALALDAVAELKNTHPFEKFKWCSMYVTPVKKPRPNLPTLNVNSYSSAADEHDA